MSEPPTPPAVRSRPLVAAALAVAGCVLVGAGLLALRSIPRGGGEFTYISDDAAFGTLWPLPFAAMNGFTPQQLSSHLARLLLLGPGCVLLGLAVGPVLARRLPRPPPGRVFALLAALLVGAAAALVFRGIPVQDDEPTYLMQARQLAQGRLGDPAVPPAARWHEPFTIFTKQGVTGKYPPGEPAVLAMGSLVQVPILLHLVFAFGVVWLVHDAARRGATRVATLSALLLATSPELLFTSATPVSQITCLASIAAALWAALHGKGYRAGLLIGAGLGLAFVSRPQMALPAAPVVALYCIRNRRAVLGALATGIPVLLAWLAYNHALTGSALALPWSLYGTERYGFGHPFGDAHPYVHTPFKAVALALVAALRLNAWALGWPLSLAGPVVWLAVGRPHRSTVTPWALVAAATCVFQLGYYSVGTSETGAIYHFATLPFFALSTAAAMDHLLETRWRAAAVGVFAAMLAIGTTTFLVEHALRLRRLTDAVARPYAALAFDEPVLAFVLNTAPTGWVFGVPFRVREATEPVVYYPAGNGAAMAYQAERWGRRCMAIWAGAGDTRLDACQRAGDLYREAQQEWSERHRASPLSSDGWREAFPWLPLAGRCPDGVAAPLCLLRSAW